MDYLILGGDGQLAQALVSLLGPNALPLPRGLANLQDPSSLPATLSQFKPRVVLNCAAYNQVDRTESDSVTAWTVNALAPAVLADWSRQNETTLVHFSTNYVFGLEEARTRPYVETDLPGPISLYGTTKLAGEYAVLSRCPRSLVVRTSGVFGRRSPGVAPSNFVSTMLRLARDGKPVRVVGDQVCTPTFTHDLAHGTLSLIRADATGLFHFTNQGQCSWYELAAAIFEEMKLDVDLTPIRSTDYPTPARRPRFSVLDCSRFERQCGPIRPWREALQEYLLGEPRG